MTARKGTLYRLSEPPCDLGFIKARCREDLGCWTWAGAKKTGRWPLASFRRIGADGVKRDFHLYVRHVVYWIKHGERPDFSGGRTLRTSCGNPECVNPAHLVMQTFSDVQRELGHQRLPANKERNAMARRRRSKLSDSAVQQIRESDLPRKDLARAHGVTYEYVRQLQIGMWRRDYRTTPFSGLGA